MQLAYALARLGQGQAALDAIEPALVLDNAAYLHSRREFSD